MYIWTLYVLIVEVSVHSMVEFRVCCNKAKCMYIY